MNENIFLKLNRENIDIVKYHPKWNNHAELFDDSRVCSVNIYKL